MKKHRMRKMGARTLGLMLAALVSVSTLGVPAFAAEAVEPVETETVTVVTETVPEEMPVQAVEEPEAHAAEEETFTDEIQTEAEQDTDVSENEMETIMETESVTEETEAPEEETSETETADEKETDPYGFTEFDPSAYAGTDFSSCRIIVETADESIFVENENIISSWNGVYLLQFSDEETAMKAYSYYSGKARITEVDIGILICEGEAGEIISTGNIMTVDDNPFSELEEAVLYGTGSYDIALIDTGAEGVNVTGAVSMIGDDPSDDNGHGTKMAGYIMEENPDAKILSVKALGSNGKGDISSVYAAVEYAISQNVKVISLSASAFATGGNLILNEAVQDAVNAGIIFVASAGNNGKNAAYYVPGNISAAFVTGAADEKGERLATSNYGETVDANVVASSTSEAAARMAGWITANGMESLGEAMNKGFVYEPGFIASYEDPEKPEDGDEEFSADATWPTQTTNAFTGVTLNSAIQWSGMDAWWPNPNGAISLSAAWQAVGEVSKISQLKPGDVVVWAEGYTPYWVNHIAIVTDVAVDGSYFVTADGNCSNSTGVSFVTRYDFYKRGSEYGKVLVWRNTVNGQKIAGAVEDFTQEVIDTNDTSMAVQWSSINWCYCFVVTALLDCEETSYYGNLQVSKTVSTPAGSLKIGKSVAGKAEDKSREFTFTLNVTNLSGNTVTTKFSYERSDGTKGTIAGNGGSLKLKDGQNAVISGIPQGYGYTVTEKAEDGFKTTVSKNGGAAASGNTVSGTIPAAKSGQSFSFTVNFKNGGANVPGLTVASGLTTDNSGNVKFSLTPGTSGTASKTMSNIPEGYTYTVTEASVSGWTTKSSGTTGTIARDTTKTAAFTNTYSASQQSAVFTNTRDTASLTVLKTTDAPASCLDQLAGNGMYAQNFRGTGFLVSIYDSQTGKWGTAKPYTAASDGKFTVSDLYVGDRIRVTETVPVKGYLLPEEPTQEITLKAGSNSLTFTDQPTFDPATPVIKKVRYENGKMAEEILIPGAVFRMEYFDNTDCSGKAVRTWYFRTNAEGTFTYQEKYLAEGYTSDALYTEVNGYPDIPLGSVRFTEVEAPAGYTVVKTPVEGKIIQNEETKLAEFEWITKSSGQVEIADGIITIGEKELAIAVDKIDAGTGRHVSGATLQLLDGEKVVMEWITDGKEKEIRETLVPDKTYTLRESKTPEGYAKAEDISFSADSDGKITVHTKDVDTYVSEHGFLGIKMEDVKKIALPFTGSSDTMWMILTGSLIILAGAGAAVILSGRKKGEKA